MKKLEAFKENLIYEHEVIQLKIIIFLPLEIIIFPFFLFNLHFKIIYYIIIIIF